MPSVPIHAPSEVLKPRKPNKYLASLTPEQRREFAKRGKKAAMALQPFALLKIPQADEELLRKYRKIIRIITENALEGEPWACKMAVDIKREWVKEQKAKKLEDDAAKRIKPPTIVIQNTINLPAPVHNQVPEPSLNATQVIDLPNVTTD